MSSAKTKYIIAGVSAPHTRMTKTGTSFEQPDTYLVTVAASYADAKTFIEDHKVPDADVMEYLVIEEIKEMQTKTELLRWYICKDKEITQLASAPEQYKKYTSMISM